MNVLLLGGTGLLGGYFQKVFQDKNINFLAPKKSELDITDIKSVQNFFDQKIPEIFSHIIFCAAYTDVNAAETHRKECLSVNVLGLKNLLEYGIPVLHFSTDYVFGSFRKDLEIEENFSRSPLNYYGKTKLQAEKLLESFQTPYWNIRTGWLFGGKNCFVEKMLKKAGALDSQNKEKIVSSNSFSQELIIADDEVGRPTFAKDLAEYVVRNFLQNKQKHGNYHLQNTGNPVSWAEFADFFLRKKNWKGCIKKVPGKLLDRSADRPKNSVLKNTKLRTGMRKWKEAVIEFLV